MKTNSIYLRVLLVALLFIASYTTFARPLCCSVNCPNSSCAAFGSSCTCGCNDAGFGKCDEIKSISVTPVQMDNILVCKAYCLSLNSSYGNKAAIRYQQIHDLFEINNYTLSNEEGNTANMEAFDVYVNELVAIIKNEFSPDEFASFQNQLNTLPQ